MAELENKYIPMQGYASYNVPVRPPRVDNGRVRTPEEIEEGTKNFRHTFYLDETGHVYIIPSMDVQESQKFLPDCLHRVVRQTYLHTVLTDVQELQKFRRTCSRPAPRSAALDEYSLVLVLPLFRKTCSLHVRW